MKFLITGGEQREPRGLSAGAKRWYKYKTGHLVKVDTDTSSIETLLSYESPQEARADEEPAILFKQGYLNGDELLLTTQTELLIYSYPSLEQTGYVSLPSFNDVHHVRPTSQGTLLLVNTGLDQLLEITRDGEVLNRWHALGGDPWGTRFDEATDYRKWDTTKPYDSHPNHVFTLGDEIWITRFKQMDAISLADPSRRLDIGIERIHDGLVHEGRIYFTAVSGAIAIFDAETLEKIEIIDLNEINTGRDILGWCRGISIHDNIAWVGFSRLRPTAFRENVAWVKEGFKKSVGTHIAAYDLNTKTLVDRLLLDDVSPLSAVFSILPIDN